MRTLIFTLIFAPLVAYGQSDDVGLNDPLEQAAPSVGAGNPLCLDDPTNSVCLTAVGGALDAEAGGASFTWDGTTLTLPYNGSTTTPEIVLGTNAGLSRNGSDTGFNVLVGSTAYWYISSTFLQAAASSGVRLKYSGAMLTVPSVMPYGSVQTSGLGGDALGLTSLISNSHDIAVVDGTGAYDKLTINGAYGAPQSALQSLLAATAITPNSSFVAIVGNGGSVTLTSNPQITAGFDGQRLIIIGTSDTNRVEIVNGNGLTLNNAVDFDMGNADTIELVYSSTIGGWAELYRGDKS